MTRPFILVLLVACDGARPPREAPPATPSAAVAAPAPPKAEEPEPVATAPMPADLATISAELSEDGGIDRIAGYPLEPACFPRPSADEAKALPEGAEQTPTTLLLRDPSPRGWARFSSWADGVAKRKKADRTLFFARGYAQGEQVGWAAMCIAEPAALAKGDFARVPDKPAAIAITKSGVARLRELPPSLMIAFMFDGATLLAAMSVESLTRGPDPVLTFGGAGGDHQGQGK